MRVRIPALLVAVCLSMTFANGFATGAEKKKAETPVTEVSFNIEGMT